jgi:hypothetical protein
MLIYLAIIPHDVVGPILNDMKFPQILTSFAHSKALNMLDYQPTEMTLDSGAFTAWNIGQKVDVQAYADWALERSISAPNVRCVNLDVIPGEKGRTSTRAERLQGMQDSVANADFLRAQGLNVMEVFHQDEPWEYLDLLLERLPSKESVLCISPRNDVHNQVKLEWHRQVLAYLVNKVGKDNLPRTHGLAVTSKSILLEFPYFSADSSSFAAPLRYGRVMDTDGKMIRNEELTGFNFRNDEYGGHSIYVRRMIEQYLRMEDMITSVWAKRGVVWN